MIIEYGTDQERTQYDVAFNTCHNITALLNGKVIDRIDTIDDAGIIEITFLDHSHIIIFKDKESYDNFIANYRFNEK